MSVMLVSALFRKFGRFLIFLDNLAAVLFFLTLQDKYNIILYIYCILAREI